MIGRPPLHPKMRRSIQIGVRFTRKDYKAIKARAMEMRVSVAEYCRIATLKRIYRLN